MIITFVIIFPFIASSIGLLFQKDSAVKAPHTARILTGIGFFAVLLGIEIITFNLDVTNNFLYDWISQLCCDCCLCHFPAVNLIMTLFAILNKTNLIANIPIFIKTIGEHQNKYYNANGC